MALVALPEPTSVITLEQISNIRSSLFEWYAQHKRLLPWRGIGDPYTIWISEIMLQQTTVAAVTPFFERWLSRFPTVVSLAEADIDEVLLHWAGLGYYARARNLHRAANLVVREYHGLLPETSAELIKLPGIGPYTAAAIASIAFGEDSVALDANVVRVVSRLGAISGDPLHEPATRAIVKEIASRLMPPGSAAEFNQALMDLGSSICEAERAHCERCPLRIHCAGYKSGAPSAYPKIVRTAKTVGHRDVAIAIVDGTGKLLLKQRPQTDTLWGGLWEMPRVTVREDELLEKAVLRALSLVGVLDANPPIPFGTVKHVVANRQITLHGFTTRCTGTGDAAGLADRCAWTHLSALARYALATPQRRLLAKFDELGRQGILPLC